MKTSPRRLVDTALVLLEGDLLLPQGCPALQLDERLHGAGARLLVRRRAARLLRAAGRRAQGADGQQVALADLDGEEVRVVEENLQKGARRGSEREGSRRARSGARPRPCAHLPHGDAVLHHRLLYKLDAQLLKLLDHSFQVVGLSAATAGRVVSTGSCAAACPGQPGRPRRQGRGPAACPWGTGSPRTRCGLRGGR